MHLMYYLNERGERVYTLRKLDPNDKPSLSAHPGGWGDGQMECLGVTLPLSSSPLFSRRQVLPSKTDSQEAVWPFANTESCQI